MSLNIQAGSNIQEVGWDLWLVGMAIWLGDSGGLVVKASGYRLEGQGFKP